MNPETQIGIGRLTLVPADLISDLTGFLKESAIPHEIHETEPTIQASVEDYVPTALMVLLAKPFFDAFLKEAGKDAYVLLKKHLASVFRKADQLQIVTVSSAGEKLRNPHNSSRIVSIYCASSSGHKLKFLFPKGASEDIYLQLIDSMFELLREERANPAKSKLAILLPKEKKRFLHVLRHSEGEWLLLP